jgi:hypothetical protein
MDFASVQFSQNWSTYSHIHLCVARNLEMNNEFFGQKDSEKLVMHKIQGW